MDPFTVLAVLGFVLVVGGFVLALRRGPEGNNELDFLGMKLKTTSVGLAFCALGVVAVVPSARQLLKGERIEVTDVTLTADTSEVRARCPVDVRFIGHISATGKGTVAYRFISVEGLGAEEHQGRLRSLVFAEDGTKRVDYPIVANVPKGDLSYTVQLEVVKPGRERSERRTTLVHCDSALPPGPPGPPPDVPGGPPD